MDPSSTNAQETMLANGPQTLPRLDVLSGIMASRVRRPPKSIRSGGITIGQAQSATIQKSNAPYVN